MATETVEWTEVLWCPRCETALYQLGSVRDPDAPERGRFRLKKLKASLAAAPTKHQCPLHGVGLQRRPA